MSPTFFDWRVPLEVFRNCGTALFAIGMSSDPLSTKMRSPLDPVSGRTLIVLIFTFRLVLMSSWDSLVPVRLTLLQSIAKLLLIAKFWWSFAVFLQFFANYRDLLLNASMLAPFGLRRTCFLIFEMSVSNCGNHPIKRWISCPFHEKDSQAYSWILD